MIDIIVAKKDGQKFKVHNNYNGYCTETVQLCNSFVALAATVPIASVLVQSELLRLSRIDTEILLHRSLKRLQLPSK